MQSCSIYFLNVVLRAACDSLEGAVCFWEEVVVNVKDETGLYSVEDCLKFSAALCLKFNKKNVTYYCAEVWTAQFSAAWWQKAALFVRFWTAWRVSRLYKSSSLQKDI